jgi:hypothetical protein
MKRVHPEFAYQARELEGQIEGVLGDPPDRRNYQRMIDALVSEYTKGGGIEDVNMMAFALVDRIRFLDAPGLMREAGDYEDGNPEHVFAMAECDGDDGKAMFEAITREHPELARRAIITAFLHKHQNRWDDENQSLDQLAEGDEGDEDEEGAHGASDDFVQMFDPEGENE